MVLGLSAVVLMLVTAAVALATSINAKPTSGPRDNGSDVQTHITVSGDLSDTVTTGFTNLGAYWDLPASPNSSYLMTDNGWTIDATGVFSVNTEVPLYDGTATTVRPGIHKITICATPKVSTNGFPICLTTNFTVLKGLATLGPTSGRPGQTINASGTRWVPGNGDEEIRLIWDPAGSASTLTNFFFPGSSTWATTFDVPNVPPGTYQVRVCNVSNFTGLCVPADTVNKTFTVVPPAVILSKPAGLPGASINISGSQFFGSSQLKLFFGPPGKPWNDPAVVEITPGTAKSTNSDGNFGPYPFAPPNPPGNYVVTACTWILTRLGNICDPNDTGTAPYTINAPATPSPTPSPTPTAKPSPTPTATPSPTPTATASASASPSASPTASASASASPSTGPTPTAGPTASVSATASPTQLAGSPAPPTPTPVAEPSQSPPSPSATPETIIWAQSLRSPGDSFSGGAYDLATLGGMSLLALLIAFLIPFPGTLFNKTVEANYIEIKSWMAGMRRRWNVLLDGLAVGPLGSLRRWLGPRMGGRTGAIVFLLLSALVYGFLSPTFGFNESSLALFLGLLVGLALITAAFDLPLRFYHRRHSQGHDSGVLRALWWTLLIAMVCVLISRLAGFQPGYLYGLIISIVFVTEISSRHEGIGTWLASLWLIVLSFAAWIGLVFVRQGAADPFVSQFLQTVLVTFVVAGIETLAIGLLPMRFLPGHPLYRWRKSMWFALFALAIFGYLLILVDPANGYLSSSSQGPMIIGIAFLVGFGIVSIGTWAYFRYRPARSGGDRPGEVATAD
jgi:hypothetical protein